MSTMPTSPVLVIRVDRRGYRLALQAVANVWETATKHGGHGATVGAMASCIASIGNDVGGRFSYQETTY